MFLGNCNCFFKRSQKLVLQSVKDSILPQFDEKFDRETDSQIMKLPIDELRQGERFPEDQETVHTIGIKFEELAVLIETNVLEETLPQKIMQLSLLMKELSKEALVTMFQTLKSQVNTNTRSKIKFEIFADLLPTAQSAAVVPAVVDLIASRSIYGLRAHIALNAIALISFPTKKNVEYLMRLLEKIGNSEGPEECSHLRQTVLLTIGSLGNKAITLIRQKKMTDVESKDIPDNILLKLARLLSEPRDVLEKIAVVKAMGNLGSKKSVILLRNIIFEPSLSESLRMHAIYALRKTSVFYPNDVHPICLAVFMDHSQPIKIRQAAFDVVRNGFPSLTVLQMIGQSMRDEPHRQIKTYVYTSLAEYARKVLKQIRPLIPGLLDSKAIDAQFFSEKLNIGGTLNLRKIRQTESPLPDKFILSSHGHIFDNHLKFIEIGVQLNKVYEMVRDIYGLGPYGEYWTQGSKGFKTEIELPKELLDWLKSKSSTMPLKEPQLEAYLDIVGQELQFVELNKERLLAIKEYRKINMFH
ncbi:hypothetical protein HELRODRAFT_182124 [Helobdella robusta]|uniref:Vitellogenin domain-containing protein n=1 Tax=Helobdella robusta TaxID=6412 RepID=T1FHS8_HELRO|nr:hypothetical protein HELRODRAFT_182124 [Helobdella robusta]ESN91266.1 hypothetical protein HELRODRAFT_182124 [Helobdella robusta]